MNWPRGQFLIYFIMSITKAKKQEINKKISSLLSDSAATVFVSFQNIPVEKNNILRKNLRSNDGNYFVTRKTLINRALDNFKATGDRPDLGDGMVALAYSTDLMTPAREVFAFSNEHKGFVEIMGGIFDGVFKSKDEMMAIATIPGMDTLRGMFANIINSPRSRFAIVLNQVAEKKS